MSDCVKAGDLHLYGFNQADSVWSVEGVAPTLLTGAGSLGHSVNVLVEDADGEG